MGIVDDIVHSIGRDVRKDAGKLLLPTLLAVAGGLTAAAGVAFLTAWAYLTLSRAVGQASASLLIGLGLTLLAAALLVLARNRFTKKTLIDPPVSQPAAPATGETDFASQIAFTTAFVLARYLGEGRRD
ncbi:phage holin family protein [Antarctobacter heliothermus]|uniref:Putative Holin-X, holin superfamily III n=1 Tax=Antarctobacter heliothermus TaxID=74033 RepID=A0A239K6N4_9RHOB|nr:phage holin family protein [Antarctobacter heliothermus]SNT13283.1 Putative Holin-X, holin superfamily III [Antarctobacter heliothermus]